MAAQTDQGQNLLGYQHPPPFDSGFLSVGEIHKIHYEQYGKKDGKPVIFLHGGPGASTSLQSTIFFDPAVYRVVLLDQRGAGKSIPCAEIRENTTFHLLSDLEVLREHLVIPKWHLVFGGSWGSTLGLLYAQAHPERVGSLVLRGIFLASNSEIDFIRGPHSASRVFPEAYDDYVAYLPPEHRGDPLKGYYTLMTSDDPKVRLEAAKSYNRWGISVSSATPGPEAFAKLEDTNWVLSHGRLETHYASHQCWVVDNQIMENIHKIKHIPCEIVHGRFDAICAPRIAYDLHKAWPGSKLHIVPQEGHSAYNPGIRNKLIEACDKFGHADFHLPPPS